MNDNKNYNLEMENIIKSLKGNKPKLLLHSCCGPCSSACLERLNEFFEITIYYYNPNLDTAKEFNRRVIEQENLIKKMDLPNKISLIIEEYNQDEYNLAIEGFENSPEGGKRCLKCFDLRFEKTAEFAKRNNFDYFTTTLSISPHKNSKVLNKLGEEVSKKYNINYLFSDFKKKNGYKRSVELSKKYDMYRQDYCGCEFSKKEAEKRRENLIKEV